MFDLTRRYRIRQWWYEKSSMNADISEIERHMTKTGLYFDLIPYIPVDNKEYRIERHVISRVENGTLKFPRHFFYEDSEGHNLDLIEDVMKVEMRSFPHGKHDDFLDMLAQLGEAPEFGRDSEPAPQTAYVHKPMNPSKAAKNTLESVDVPSYI
jgi:hypothetical protein